jgi:hypothetical protein
LVLCWTLLLAACSSDGKGSDAPAPTRTEFVNEADRTGGGDETTNPAAGSPETSSPNQNTTGEEIGTDNVCALVTLEEVNAALDATITQAEPLTTLNFDSGTPHGITCRWGTETSGPLGLGQVAVQQRSTEIDAIFEIQYESPEYEQIDGLGERAHFWPASRQSGPLRGTGVVHVMVEDYVLRVDFTDTTRDGRKLREPLVTLAEIAIDRLP